MNYKKIFIKKEYKIIYELDECQRNNLNKVARKKGYRDAPHYLMCIFDDPAYLWKDINTHRFCSFHVFFYKDGIAIKITETDFYTHLGFPYKGKFHDTVIPNMKNTINEMINEAQKST